MKDCLLFVLSGEEGDRPPAGVVVEPFGLIERRCAQASARCP